MLNGLLGSLYADPKCKWQLCCGRNAPRCNLRALFEEGQIPSCWIYVYVWRPSTRSWRECTRWSCFKQSDCWCSQKPAVQLYKALVWSSYCKMSTRSDSPSEPPRPARKNGGLPHSVGGQRCPNRKLKQVCNVDQKEPWKELTCTAIQSGQWKTTREPTPIFVQCCAHVEEGQSQACQSRSNQASAAAHLGVSRCSQVNPRKKGESAPQRNRPNGLAGTVEKRTSRGKTRYASHCSCSSSLLDHSGACVCVLWLFAHTPFCFC